MRNTPDTKEQKTGKESVMFKKTVILFYPLIEKNQLIQNLPYSILYLERAIRDLEIEVVLIDERINPDYENIIIDKSSGLLLTGVSCMIGYQLEGAIRFTDLIKKHTRAKVIWGGWFPTVFTNMVQKENKVDYICIGQGEIILRNLLKCLLNKELQVNINGLIINNEPNKNVLPNPLQNFNDLPAIDFELSNLNKIIDLNGKVEQGHRGADYLATIGCPHNCSFCNLTYIFGRKWFPKQIPEIIKDLEILVTLGNLSHITFSDDNFFVTRSFVLSFCNALIDSGLKITWEANAHVNSFLSVFKEEDILIIKKSGCIRVKIGAESGDQEVLDLIRKETKVEDNLLLIKRLKKAGIGIRFYTMVLFPLNPEKDIRETLTMNARAKMIYSKLDININVFKPIPKTDLYPMAQSFQFNYPDTIQDLLKLLKYPLVFPWHKRNYYKQLFYFTEVYFPFANINYFRNFTGVKKIIYFFLNIYFLVVVWFRILLKCWRYNWSAYLFCSITGKKYTDLQSEKIAVLKSR
jgi:anaerobic magnesium-protoporphyrin IX monomethyl ester cyclase